MWTIEHLYLLRSEESIELQNIVNCPKATILIWQKYLRNVIYTLEIPCTWLLSFNSSFYEVANHQHQHRKDSSLPLIISLTAVQDFFIIKSFFHLNQMNKLNLLANAWWFTHNSITNDHHFSWLFKAAASRLPTSFLKANEQLSSSRIGQWNANNNMNRNN